MDMDFFESIVHVMNEDRDSDDEYVVLGPRQSAGMRRRRRAFGEVTDTLRRFGQPEVDPLISVVTSGLTEFQRLSSESKVFQPLKLIDRAAKVAARFYSAARFEACQPPLDEALWEKVTYWAFPQDLPQVQAMATVGSNVPKVYNGLDNPNWQRGLILANEDKVKEISQVGFLMTAQVQKADSSPQAPFRVFYDGVPEQHESSSTDVRVAITFERQQITSSTCSECKDVVWCPHVNAAIIYRICDGRKVPNYAPMTEILSTLSKVQLQKLVQYAIEEDPAGILGKIFSRIKMLRDPTSEISSMDGAPDPTLGTVLGNGELQWEKSLKLMGKTFALHLKDLHEVRQNFEHNEVYPDSLDWADKTDAKMYIYISRALQLHKAGDNRRGLQVILSMLELTAMGTKLLDVNRFPPYARFLHDFIRLTGTFLISPRVSDGLLEKVFISLNRCMEKHVMWKNDIACSKWAELPPLTSLYPQAAHELEENQLFVELYAVRHVPPYPKELHNLVEGVTPVRESTYDEPLQLMMWRLESLLQESTTDQLRRVARCFPVILKKLAHACFQFSVLAELDELDLRDSSDARLLEEFGCILQNGSSKGTEVRFKGKSKRSLSGKGKSPAKRARKTLKPADTSGLSESQLSYMLLYCVHLASACFKVTCESFIDPQYEIFVNLLALEVARCRTVAAPKELCMTEHNWLYNLECSTVKCVNRLAYESDENLRMVRIYMEAMKCVGMDFYEMKYPLMLLDVAFTVAREYDRERFFQIEDMVQISASVLVSASESIKKYVMPTETGLNLIINLFEIGREFNLLQRQEAHKQFIQKKFHTISKTFFSLIQADQPEERELLTKVLTHLAKVEHLGLLIVIYQDIRSCGAQIEKSREVMEACLKFSLHAYRRMREGPFASRANSDLERTFLFSLAHKLGISSLAYFKDNWHNIFTVKEMVELLEMLSSQVKPGSNFPPEISELVLQYFCATHSHGQDAHTLLKVFKAGDANYAKAVKAVLEKPEKFSYVSLFELAIWHELVTNGPWEGTSGAGDGRKKGAAKDKKNISAYRETRMISELWPPSLIWPRQVSKEVVELGLSGLKLMAEMDMGHWSAQSMDYLEWLVLRLSSGRTVSAITKSPAFKRLLAVLSEHCNRQPEMLVRSLQCFSKKDKLIQSPLLSSLREALLEAYEAHFHSIVSGSTSASYTGIVNKLVKAREHCKQFINPGNGAKMFEDKVLAMVRKRFSGKKKLQKMINEEFGPKEKK